MNYNMKVIIYTFIVFTLVSMTLLVVVRGDVVNESITKNEQTANLLSEPALTLIIFGFVYVIAFRLNRHRNQIFKANNKKYGDIIRQNYIKWRRPLLFSHSIINLVATFFGIIHGVNNLDQDWDIQYTTGFLALVSMIILSSSGIIIYFRNNPLWSNRNSRKILRSFHKQWIVTTILIVSLLFHTSFG